MAPIQIPESQIHRTSARDAGLNLHTKSVISNFEDSNTTVGYWSCSHTANNHPQARLIGQRLCSQWPQAQNEGRYSDFLWMNDRVHLPNHCLHHSVARVSFANPRVCPQATSHETWQHIIIFSIVGS